MIIVVIVKNNSSNDNANDSKNINNNNNDHSNAHRQARQWPSTWGPCCTRLLGLGYLVVTLLLRGVGVLKKWAPQSELHK